MNSHGDLKTSVYIIDKDFKIVYANNGLKQKISDKKLSPYCYKVIGNEHGQCQRCPLRKENDGKSILFDCLHNEWISVTAAPIKIPVIGSCHIILAESMVNDGKNFFYNTAGKSDYDEMLELDYLNDSYSVVYHGERKENSNNLKGSISATIQNIAAKQIHPDDRKRFCDFWLLDRVGTEGVPEDMLATRHGEFRKLRIDGGYRWAQQVLMPVRKASKNAVFVNSFYNLIDAPFVGADEYTDGQLYGKNSFFRCAGEMLVQSSNETPWCVIAVDIEKFKLFNEWYGSRAGDELLEDLSDCVKEYFKKQKGIGGYFGNDDFALFVPYDEEQIDKFGRAVTQMIKLHSDRMHVLPAIGVYEISDKNIPAFKAYDYANLASAEVKGNYITRIKKFDQVMLDKIESEYLLFSDIQKAFRNKEFTFVLQPKCNMKTGKIVGAEALARWNSKEKGFVSPAVFIPFLENSGYIAELDTFIWEEVCKWQRHMADIGGCEIPVSVNVSRADLYSVDVPAYFDGLIKKYGISSNLIEVEITESAYIEDDGFVNRNIEKLRKLGFRVLMDDFGSAYSSLNMLKDITVDTLKIDMRFLDMNDSTTGKGLDILETVCNMASILGLNIIVEGVETEQQRNYLLTMRCTYGQGYYFYRPLAVSDFEKELQQNAETELDADSDENVEKIERLYLKDLLGEDIFSEIMVNNMLGAIVFYDVYKGQVTIKRYNEQYAMLLGSTTFSAETKMKFGAQLYQDDYEKIFAMFDEAKKNRHVGVKTEIRRRRADGTDMWLHLKTFFLHEQNGHAVYYSSVRDVTEAHETNATIRFLNNDMPGGYYRHENNNDCDFTHISERFLDIFGFTREEIKEEFDDKFINMVHPEDREAIRNRVHATKQHGGNYYQPCRMRSKSGYIFVIDLSRLVEYNGEEFFQGIILCNLDHYKWLSDKCDKVKENKSVLQWMPCGVFQAEADANHAFKYISDSMLDMLGYSHDEFLNKFNNCTENMVYKEDRERIYREIRKQMAQGVYTACEFRIEMADGSLKWVYSRGRLVTDVKGKRWFYASVSDYDYLMDKYQRQEWQYQKYKTLAEIPGMIVYDYDPRNDCLTVEISLQNGETEKIVYDRYIENIDNNGVLANECVAEQKKILLKAVKTPINDVTELKACFLKTEGYRWYRFYFKSLANKDGKVYRLVGRGDRIAEDRRDDCCD